MDFPHSHPLPLGFRFRPTDDELIDHFLRRRIEGVGLSDDCPVKEMDLYGEKEPWEIWDMFGGSFVEKHGNGIHDLFFFTKLKLKKSRAERNVGCGGTWSGERLKKIFSPETGNLLGFVRRFHYENRSSSSHHSSSWIMHEFSMPQPSLYVLCRLRKSGNKAVENKVVNKRKCQDQQLQLRPTKKSTQAQPQPLQAPAPPNPTAALQNNNVDFLDDFFNEVGIWDCEILPPPPLPQDLNQLLQ